MLKTKGFFMTVALAGAALASPAMAGDSNGNFQIKVGATWVNTMDKTNSITSTNPALTSAATLAAIGITDADAVDSQNTWLPTATLTYYFNKNLAVELFCCAGGTSLVGKNQLAGIGEAAHTYMFPPILTLQYHLDGMGPFRPYVGAGVQWIHWFPKVGDNALNADDVKIRDNFGFVLQAGVDFDLGGGWSLGLDVKKSWLNETKVTFSGTNIAGLGVRELEVKHDLNPLFVTANLGYRFNLCDILGGCGGGAPLK